MLNRFTTFIVEPNGFVRQGLQACLSDALYNVVGSVQTIATGNLQGISPDPDLVIFGPGTSDDLLVELAGLKGLGQQSGRVRVVLLVDLAAEDGYGRVRDLGVNAVLSKDVTADVFLKSLELVMLGQYIFPISRATAAETREAAIGLRTRTDLALSERELQALRGLMAGESNKLIAQRLVVSEATVKARIKSLLRKIGASNRTQAALWAVQHPDIGGNPTPTSQIDPDQKVST